MVVDIVDLDDGLVGVPHDDVVGGAGVGGVGTQTVGHRNVNGPPGPPGGQIPWQI